MNAVLVRLTAELRSRWPAWLGLALLIGLAGGGGPAAAGGGARAADGDRLPEVREGPGRRRPRHWRVPRGHRRGTCLHHDRALPRGRGVGENRRRGERGHPP